MRMSPKFTRLLLFAAFTALLVSGCADAPLISADVEGGLAANAVARACESYSCDAETIYVHSRLFSMETEPSEEVEMPEQTRMAIEEQLGDVEFVDQREADALFGEDFLVEGGKGVLISVGPVEDLASDVVGIEIGVVTARDGGHGELFQFQWTGDEWNPATSDDTGIPSRFWIS
jgi:hypothetical protein